MSLPIKETPVLTGKDTIKFLNKMREVDNGYITKSDKALYKFAWKTYKEVREKCPDWKIVF